MNRAGFQKSVRMFHKFSSETMRRAGANPAGRESVAALAAIESVLKAERTFDAALLEPLAAFTNLLQSAQLPPEFGNYSFGDAILAIEEAQAELRQADPQRWEFSPELDEPSAAEWLASVGASAGIPSSIVSSEHGQKLRRFVLDALASAEPTSALVVGAAAAPELPLAELAAHFERLTLSDVEPARLEALLRDVPEPARRKISLERYDVTGSYSAFAKGTHEIVTRAKSAADAEDELAAWIAGYDVGAGSAGLSAKEERPALAISAMLLGTLGDGYAEVIATAFAGRGWDRGAPARAPLLPALRWLGCLVQQHHIHALLRRARKAVLVSPVSRVLLRRLPQGGEAADGEPQDLLFVERLSERLPQFAEVQAEQSWEARQNSPGESAGRALVTLVEAVRVSGAGSSPAPSGRA